MAEGSKLRAMLAVARKALLYGLAASCTIALVAVLHFNGTKILALLGLLILGAVLAIYMTIVLGTVAKYHWGRFARNTAWTILATGLVMIIAAGTALLKPGLLDFSEVLTLAGATSVAGVVIALVVYVQGGTK